MILVSVGNEHTPQFLLILNQIGKVGDHQIHAVHIFLGKSQTAIHNDHILAVFQNGDVFANLIQTAQGDDF